MSWWWSVIRYENLMDRPGWFCRLFGAEVMRADESKETSVSVTWSRRTPRLLTCQTHLPPWPAPRCSPGTRPSCSRNTREGQSPAAGRAGWWAWCCRACRSCDSHRCTSGSPCVWWSDTGAGCRGPATGRTAATAQSGPHRGRSTAAWPAGLAERRLGPQPLQTEHVIDHETTGRSDVRDTNGTVKLLPVQSVSK